MPETPITPQGNIKRILAADDNPVCRMALKQLLEESNPGMPHARRPTQ